MHAHFQAYNSNFFFYSFSCFEALSQEAADFPEQQEAFFPASAVFPAQQEAALLSQEDFLPSFLLLAFVSLLFDVLLSAVFVPLSETFFRDWLPSFEVTVFSVDDFEVVVEASVWALTANAKNANTLRIRTFFIQEKVKVFRK